MCADSFIATSAGNCVPVEKCNSTKTSKFKDFSFTSRADCSENMVCRLGVCYCKPGYKLDEIGECVPRSQRRRPPFRSNADVFAELRIRLHRLTSFNSLVFIVNLIVIAGLALYCTLAKRQKRRNLQVISTGRQYSSLLPINEKEIFFAKIC